MTTLKGLTNEDVLTRRKRGEGNDVDNGTIRSNWQITRTNLFSTYNIILFTIGIVLTVLGRYSDAFITVIVGLTNAIISTFQEVRAKQQLARIAVVASSTVTVRRDGDEQTILPSEVVKGDLIRLQSGDQAAVDGSVIASGSVEMDESLLTGEADHIRKNPGDTVLSGSFCVSGDAWYEAEKVGLESYANKLVAEAREFSPISTPLQENVSYTINLLIILAVIMAAIFYMTGFVQDFSFVTNVKATAVLVGLVPYGLFLTIAVAYALGATAISKKGALVQQTNAVESLNNVDVLCMDKTGTLTANELALNNVDLLSEHPNVEAMLGAFVHSISASNTTNAAIATGVAGKAVKPVGEVPFSSARKWSALAFDGETGQHGVYVLGAVEMMAAHLPPGSLEALMASVTALSDRGLRVLLFAANTDETALYDVNGEPSLPMLTPLAIVSLRDKLRPRVAETLREFQQLGVGLKIISGDNPDTVAALAKQAGLSNVTSVSGPALAQLNDVEIAQVAEETVVFGRISPEQKQQLVGALKQNGHYVAMIGDGVNDVLSLKNAHLGIAMQSGSSATRNVADMVLLNDSYAALPHALSEGKRIVRGITDATYLLVGRGLIYALVIIGVLMVGITFPFEPAQTGLTTFSVGLPAFCLTLWARPDAPREPLLASMVRLVIPYAIWTMLIGILLYTFTFSQATERITTESIPPRALRGLEEVTGRTFNVDEDFEELGATIIAQTALSSFLTLAAIIFILFLEPPHKFFTGWREVSPDKRPLLLALALSVIFLIALQERTITDYFGMIRLPNPIYVTLVVSIICWVIGMRFLLRSRIFDILIPGSGQPQ